MDRWKDALTPLRKRSVRLAHYLGRSPHAGDGLNSSMLPEEYGAKDDIDLTTVGGTDSGQLNLRAVADKEAQGLVRGLSTHDQGLRPRRPRPTNRRSKSDTPPSEKESDESLSLPAGTGILASLIKLQALQFGNPGRDSVHSVGSDSEAAPVSTPPLKKKKFKWYDKSDNPNASSSSLLLPSDASAPRRRKRRKKHKEEVRLTVHVAAVLARQKYIMQLCRALMATGAPTHRLEEYMRMTANVLEVDAQFLYLPGCMIMSFDDASTRTAQVKLVRTAQDLDLARLSETHNIYKNVVHDQISVEQAVEELDQVMKRKPRYNKYLMVFLSGIASTCIGPWAFGARPIDMPIIFILSSILAFMQYIVAPHSALYSNVFEVSMAIFTSFLARAFGSIPARGDEPGKYMFCFSAIAQSSICLILSGFAVLCSSLELQSHSIIAGSVRLVYTIIYSLFLGYGVTVGTTIYGLFEGNASSETTCSGATAAYGNEYIQHFPFVAIYCFLAALTCQGNIKQTPIMILLGVSGYVSNYFCTKRLGSSMGLGSTAGAFTIGVLANLYSRIWHGQAAPAIIPAIFTIVSSGLASTGSIISGLSYANAVRDHDVQKLNTQSQWSNSVTGLGLGMIQVAIGVTIGLFISALVVYPFGKTRSALFSF